MSIASDLNEAEMIFGAVTGARRFWESVSKGRQNGHGFRPVDGQSLAAHVEGACGEIAAAKACNRYWGGHVGSFKGPDIGKRLQVRTRSKHDYDLLVRADDDDDHGFMLVTGCAPFFVVHGWLWGWEAKRDEYLQSYGDREPAFFVPQALLHEIGERT